LQLTFAQIEDLLATTVAETSRMQKDFMSMIAARPDSDLASIKYEAGRLQGIGDFTEVLLFKLKKMNEEEFN